MFTSGARNVTEALGARDPSANWDTNTLTAKGTEFEVHANLTPSWTLTANIGLPRASTTDAFPSFQKDFAEHEAEWRAVANDPADPRSSVISNAIQTIQIYLAPVLANNGIERIGNRKLTANLVTRYQFSTPALKGLAIGTGINYLGDQKIGRDVTLGQDIYTEGYYIVSAFARYNGRWRNHAWNIQANASNLLDDDNFRYLSVVAGGYGPWRVVPPRLIKITLNLSF